MSLSPVVTALGVLASGYLLSVLWSRQSNASSLPPGPKGLPLIGNILDMPSGGKEWLTYADWGKRWGGIVSVKLLGQPIIILNDYKVMDLFDKKSAIYSDRPKLWMGGELIGYSKTLVLAPYANRFRSYRRNFARLIGTPNAVQKFWKMEEREAHIFIQRVLAGTEGLEANLRKLSAAMIMEMAYGIPVQEKDDPFVSLIETANGYFNIASTPGNFLVDVFPLLRHVPAWFPGANFKRLAAKWGQAFDDMVEVPYTHTKKLMAAGTCPHSFVSTALEHEEKLSEDEIFDIKHTAASIYGGGADTTVSAQHAFFLAMLLNPDVQKKAQAELDQVIGSDRLPSFSDRDNLPYIHAVVLEILRWHNVAPLAVPHCATEDGIIEGYFIPKGALIISNLWSMQHDPSIYPDPFKFDPSRFLGDNPQRDPRLISFGWGRRICPGQHFAEASLYISIAMSLAVFDILPAEENGKPILPAHENTSGTISHPVAFPYQIKPRSQRALSLITSPLAA